MKDDFSRTDKGLNSSVKMIRKQLGSDMLFWYNINGFKWKASIYSGRPKGEYHCWLPVFLHKLPEIFLWRFRQQTLTGAERIFLRSKSSVGWHLFGWFRRGRGLVWDRCEVLYEATQKENIKNISHTHTLADISMKRRKWSRTELRLAIWIQSVTS